MLVYFGLFYLTPTALAALLLIITLIRAHVALKTGEHTFLLPIVVAALYSVTVVISDSPLLLRCYPIVMNLIAAYMFGITLLRPPTMIERIAAIRGVEPHTPASRHYMKRLTVVWTIFLIINCVISTYTVTATTLGVWAIYNGFIVYILFGLLLGGEIVYRAHYKRHINSGPA
jgi:uncharacterized membrane protein